MLINIIKFGGIKNVAFIQRNICYLMCQNQLTRLKPAILSQNIDDSSSKRFTHRNNFDENKSKFSKSISLLLVGSGLTIGLKFFNFLGEEIGTTVNCKEQTAENAKDAEKWHTINRSELPTYKMEDITKHNSLESSVWVTYGIGVYDVTKFVPEHPGGDKIMMAAGSAVDPFWHLYQQHNTKEVLELLESFRIGNLHPEDDVGTIDLGSPWAKEPKRHPILKPAAERPFNAEPPISLLTESFYTPKQFFYVRNHLPVPDIDVSKYELEIEIENSESTKNFKLDDLKKFPKHTVTSAVMCGGNRRSEMNEVKVVRGLSWGAAAVGNAKWSGVLLRDVLKDLGVSSDDHRHVIFEGCDTDPMSYPYAASIPLSKAMDERGDVLLAYEMNDEPLTRDHGYPLRVIVPGVVGARNVKWVGKIIVSESESDSHWQQNDYKGFSPSTDWDTVDFSKSPAIQNMPVTSAICSPLADEKITPENGYITVKGYAWSGGGCRIIRVDLTADKGQSWHVAELEQEDNPAGRHWGWTLWTAKIPAPAGQKEIEIWSKAVDSNYNTQPESFKNVWNLRGVLSNAYHRVRVYLN